MALFDNIVNGELGSSVRAKLNAVIDWVNMVKTNVTENTAFNLFWGANAGEDITTGNENTGVGSQALSNITDGLSNTAIGAESQQYGKHQTRNQTVGVGSMTQILNGNYGTAMGYLASGSGRFIWRNVAVGYKCIRDNLVGRDNTAIGYKALQDMKSSAGGISSYTDIGGGQIEVYAGGHGRIENETVWIIGTGPWVDHSWTDNYDGEWVITNVTANTFEITAAYIDPGDLLYAGYWYKDGEATGNLAAGYAAGITLGKGSYNTLLGYAATAPDPDANWQLYIHAGLITGLYTGNIQQAWTKVNSQLVLGGHPAAPYVDVEGSIYYNSTDKHFYGYDGTAWKQLDN